MPTSPDPTPSPEGPRYQGRLLARPDDEVVDQGAGFDVATLFTRRRMLGLVGLSVGAVTLAACGADGSSASSTSSTSGSGASSGTSAGEIPEETNGPYPADGTNDVTVLDRSGIVRRDITTSIGGGAAVEGVPLTMRFRLVDMAGGDVPFEGAALYAWHCNAQGEYSMYSEGVEDETWLRGIQVADADGALSFETIVPGCYSGRWPHIHFEVYPDLDSATDVSEVIATSQLAFPADMLADVYALDAYSGSTQNLAGVGTKIADDNLFGEGDWTLQVPTITGDAESGYTATLEVKVDTATEPSAGGMGGGPGAGGGDGGPNGGPGGGEPPSGEPPSGEPPSDQG